MSQRKTMLNVISSFPYEKIREPQKKILEFAEEEFINKGKRFLIIEAGTGVGKSAIGFTIAKHMERRLGASSYFLTTQKILQEQYVGDFSKLGMKSIKSSTNYKCRYKKHISCSQGQTEIRTEEKGTKFWNACTFNCTYKKAKQDFIDSPLAVTNFPYLLTESNYSGKIKPRQLLIMDEAHNVETELSKFIEVSVSEKFCKMALKLKLPVL